MRAQPYPIPVSAPQTLLSAASLIPVGDCPIVPVLIPRFPDLLPPGTGKTGERGPFQPLIGAPHQEPYSTTEGILPDFRT